MRVVLLHPVFCRRFSEPGGLTITSVRKRVGLYSPRLQVRESKLPGAINYSFHTFVTISDSFTLNGGSVTADKSSVLDRSKTGVRSPKNQGMDTGNDCLGQETESE